MRRLFLLLLALAPLSPAFADALSGNFLAQVVKTSKPHRDSLNALIRGKQGIPTWVRNMIVADNYITLASQQKDVEGKPMQLFPACQFKRCEESAIRLLYSEDGKHVVMRIEDSLLGVVFLGNPTAAEKMALQP
ncbi:Ivy family c-type lysozyme inhibitor [Allorhizobium undicola]|uniref:Ivy family c-type lysozyme inhibitor n=1 Tax=Allorhizobium undicola TaxID=78527 RepID=UPI000488E33A|nr:Ivy family c-type lysozyme inhibitor [Allorhizobium undicola]